MMWIRNELPGPLSFSTRGKPISWQTSACTSTTESMTAALRGADPGYLESNQQFDGLVLNATWSEACAMQTETIRETMRTK